MKYRSKLSGVAFGDYIANLIFTPATSTERLEVLKNCLTTMFGFDDMLTQLVVKHNNIDIDGIIALQDDFSNKLGINKDFGTIIEGMFKYFLEYKKTPDSSRMLKKCLLRVEYYKYQPDHDKDIDEIGRKMMVLFYDWIKSLYPNHRSFDRHNAYHDIDAAILGYNEDNLVCSKHIVEVKFRALKMNGGIERYLLFNGSVLNETDISALFQNLYYVMINPIGIQLLLSDLDLGEVKYNKMKYYTEYINIRTGIHVSLNTPTLKYHIRLKNMDNFFDRFIGTASKISVLCFCDKCRKSRMIYNRKNNRDLKNITFKSVIASITK